MPYKWRVVGFRVPYTWVRDFWTSPPMGRALRWRGNGQLPMGKKKARHNDRASNMVMRLD